MPMDSEAASPLREKLDALADLDIRERLSAIGEIRSQQDTEEQELMDAIRELVPLAKEAGVSVTELARRLNIHRTTIYRVYND